MLSSSIEIIELVSWSVAELLLESSSEEDDDDEELDELLSSPVTELRED